MIDKLVYLVPLRARTRRGAILIPQTIVTRLHRSTARDHSPTCVMRHLAPPGRYRVVARESIQGLVLPLDQIVDLKPSTMTDVVIRLVRK